MICFWFPHKALRKVQLPAIEPATLPMVPTVPMVSVPLDYHSIPLPLGKEIDIYKVNMAGMGHGSVRLST